MSDESVKSQAMFACVVALVMMGLGAVAVFDTRDATPAKIQAAITACPGVANAVKHSYSVISVGALSTMLEECEEEISSAVQQRENEATLAEQKRATEVSGAPK